MLFERKRVGERDASGSSSKRREFRSGRRGEDQSSPYESVEQIQLGGYEHSECDD